MRSFSAWRIIEIKENGDLVNNGKMGVTLGRRTVMYYKTWISDKTQYYFFFEKLQNTLQE